MKRFAVFVSVVAVSSFAFAVPALAAAPPANDAYAGRTLIGSLPFSDLSLDTSSATTDANDAEMNTLCGFAATDASVWYEFAAPSDETIIIDTSGSSYPVGLIVATGSPGTFASVACGVVFGGAAPQAAAVSGPLAFPAVNGETYAILAFDPQFDGGGNGGTLNISVEVAPPPPTVTLTVDPNGHFNKVSGSATISGTVACIGVALYTEIDVQLTQAVGRFTISGFGAVAFVCDGTIQPWTVEVFGSSGLFKGGRVASDTFALACGPVECGFDEVTRSIRLRA